MTTREQVITKVQSSVSAKRVLDEIVVAGGYQAIGFHDGFVIYSKRRNEITEQVFVRKLGDKEFEVVRKTIPGGD